MTVNIDDILSAMGALSPGKPTQRSSKRGWFDPHGSIVASWRRRQGRFRWFDDDDDDRTHVQ
jgi:hypothetical protein